MSNITDELDIFLDGVKSMIHDVEMNVANRNNDFRSMCFYNIYNRAVLTHEVVNLLDKTSKPDIPDDEKAQEAERMMIVTRGMFIDIMSSIEKAAKDCLEAYWMNDVKEIALKDNSYLYLRFIMYASFEKGIIDERQKNEWDDILLMRNLVMHNNSVSDRSRVFEMDGIRISMRPDRMMKGPSTTFVVLSKKATELFYGWLRTVSEVYAR